MTRSSLNKSDKSFYFVLFQFRIGHHAINHVQSFIKSQYKNAGMKDISAMLMLFFLSKGH